MDIQYGEMHTYIIEFLCCILTDNSRDVCGKLCIDHTEASFRSVCTFEKAQAAKNTTIFCSNIAYQQRLFFFQRAIYLFRYVENKKTHIIF